MPSSKRFKENQGMHTAETSSKQQSDEAEKRRYRGFHATFDAYTPLHGLRARTPEVCSTIDPALLQMYQPASQQATQYEAQHGDAELHHLLAPLIQWHNQERWKANAPQRSPVARQHSHSPPPPSPGFMHSLGWFKPRIARRIAERVYGTTWRDWERARERLHLRGKDGGL